MRVDKENTNQMRNENSCGVRKYFPNIIANFVILCFILRVHCINETFSSYGDLVWLVLLFLYVI